MLQPMTGQYLPMSTDHLAALFSQYTPRAQAFFAGNICSASIYENQKGLGYLHILKGGRARMQGAMPKVYQLTEPSIVLFPRDTPHQLVPDPKTGANLICATVQLGSGQNNPIALGLPDVLVMSLEQISSLAPTLDLLLDEAFAERPGRQVALDRLFDYVLIQLLRYVVSAGMIHSGILAGLSDERLARAITSMHERPERAWSLEDLANEAGMSRTRFAAYFREKTGLTPVDYLTRWRMTVAQNMLMKGSAIKSVSRAVGYENPTSLSRTFTKIVGCSPANG